MTKTKSMQDKQEGFSVAAIQMVSTPVLQENFNTVRNQVAQAARQGAQLVLLPEYWPIMGMRETDKLSCAETLGDGLIQTCMAQLAKEHQIFLIGGTLPLLANEAGKVRNTTLVYGPDGQCISHYDKVHLFSFQTAEESYDEAATIVHGQEVRCFQAPCGQVGLSICYDLRFPELYRAMGECSLIVVPAAFTYTTGAAHWEVLLRARAIENQCYVLAAAQGGQHLNHRRTWGHSMLIDPWGEIKAVLAEGEGVVSGIIDYHRLKQVRESLPALRHKKLGVN